MASAVGKFFLGPDRKLRPLWRAIIFAVLAEYVLAPLLGYLIDNFLFPGQTDFSFAPGPIALSEAFTFVIALLCTAIFAVYERRRVDSYGLAINRALGAPTWEGFAAGVVMAGAVALAMYLLGGMQVRGLAVSGTAIAGYGLAWLGASLAIGLAEEFYFRSYFLQTLWKAIGFWPASIVIALLFAALHYFFKQGENMWDVITLVSLSLMMCYSVLRTGSLWFAVGFHVAFDYMQFFVIGTPNGNEIPIGRLFDATFNGPAWLTGGVLGTEASFLMYPMIALTWAYIWWRYRGNPNFAPR
ncbi:MAG TPA: type II CAAX endopeptidase family protein [Sphingomicrobium sp.]